MNVYVVSFDESENADNPLLSAYISRPLMERAVWNYVVGTDFADEVHDALTEGGDFTVMAYDPDTGERMQTHTREVRLEEASEVLAKGVL